MPAMNQKAKVLALQPMAQVIIPIRRSKAIRANWLPYPFIKESNFTAMKNKISTILFAVAITILFVQNSRAQETVNIIFTSDAHFGITRPKFRGDSNVASNKVNAAMIRQMNALPAMALPADGGIGACFFFVCLLNSSVFFVVLL